MADRIINGKVYPLWNQFVDKADEWKGGILIDNDMGVQSETIIKDIVLEANGDSASFHIIGQDFDCGFGVQYGGITGQQPFGKDYLTFSGYGGHMFGIKKP
jgi:hypothetical protein